MTFIYLLVIFLFPLGTTAYLATKMRLGQQSIKWPTVTGEVTHFKIEKRERSSKFPSMIGNDFICLPNIKYRYVVNDKEYHSKRIKFNPDMYYQVVSASDQEPALPFKINQNRVDVYYMPSNPAVSVLAPGVANSKSTYLVIVIVWFITSIIYGCLSVLVKMAAG